MVNGLPVCDDSWDTKDGVVVCRQLGFYGLQEVTTLSRFGRVYSIFAMDDVYCSGDEERLEDCQYNPSDNCDGGEGAGVICIPEPPPLKNVSLVGGYNRGEGSVMLDGFPLGGA